MLEGFVLIAAYSAHRSDGETAALGIHLIVYCAIAACFAYGLYAMLQPSRGPNSGLTAYKPPPATVISYGKPFLPNSVVEPIASAAPIEPELTTTGCSDARARESQADGYDAVPAAHKQAGQSRS